MEQQKILWIIFSVTFFLAAVIVGGLVLLKPGNEPNAEAVGDIAGDTEARSEISPYDFRDLLNGEGEIPPVPGDEEDGSLDVAEETGLEENPELPEAIDNVELEVSSGRELRSAESRIEKKKSTPAVSAAKPVQQAAPQTSAKPAAVSRSQSKPKPRKTTDYWIQLASYPKKSSAEQTQEGLLEKGLTTSIFTWESDGKTWYRLRNGPYLTFNEANKFLDWVKKIPGYEKSWIVPEKVTR